MRPLIPLLPLAAALAAPAPCQTQLLDFPGPPSSKTGPVVGGHDLNGDGHDEVIVGSPYDDTAGGNAGAVRAYSGETGAQLWVRYGANDLDGLGWALATSPDRNGDGVRDLVVGAPFALQGGSLRPGCMLLLSGKTGATLGIFWGTTNNESTGYAVAAEFDWNVDGAPDLAAGAPGSGKVRIWNGATGLSLVVVSGGAGDGFGNAMASVGDVDGNGSTDLAVGSPDYGSNDQGAISVMSSTTSIGIVGVFAGEHLGSALSPGPDIDLDGNPDLLAGLPLSDQFGADAGLVRAYSAFASNGTVLRTWAGDSPGDRFGSSVAMLGDVDGDGVSDFVAGAPVGAPSSNSGAGYARVISGRFGAPLFDLHGEASQPWGGFGTFVGDVGDVNGDAIPDVGVGDPESGATGESGRVRVFSGSCPGFVAYCTAGQSASGCAASIGASGTPSATQPVPFALLASGVEGDKDGLFFFGWNGRQANPWGNGTSLQCVVPPVKRAGLLDGTGTAGACDGAFGQDLNAVWQTQPAKNPGPGAVVQAQLWYRDPQSTSNQTTSLSNALEFALCP